MEVDTTFKPETSVSYDAGIYHRFSGKFDLRITGNHIRTRNYIVVDVASSYYTSAYAYQVDLMKFYGVEAEFNWKATDDLVLFGNYSYLKNDYDADEALPNAMLLQLPPRNKGKISARYDLPYKMRISSDIKFIGERKTEGNYTLDRYAIADFGLDKKFANRMTLGFFVNNLFGMDYQEVYGYPAPGRTFGIQLRVQSQPDSSVK